MVVKICKIVSYKYLMVETKTRFSEHVFPKKVRKKEYSNEIVDICKI